MTQYTTQMDAARKGIVTPQIKTVAEKEHMPVEKMMQREEIQGIIRWIWRLFSMTCFTARNIPMTEKARSRGSRCGWDFMM